MTKNRKGFVIVELAVVLALAAVLAGALWMFFSFANRQGSRIDASLAGTQARLLLVERLSDDTAQAIRMELSEPLEATDSFRILRIWRLDRPARSLSAPSGSATVRLVTYEFSGSTGTLERDGLPVVPATPCVAQFRMLDTGALAVVLPEAKDTRTLLLRPGVRPATGVFSAWQPAFDDRG